MPQLADRISFGLQSSMPGRQFLRREAAEHHRVDRADPRAGQHGEQRLRHHRHVKNDAVALADAEILQHGGERLHLGEQFRIGERALGMGDGRIVDQRRLAAAATQHVAVERVVAGVADGAGEPAAVDAALGIEHGLRRLDPVDVSRGFAPEALRIAQPTRINLVIAARAGVHGMFLRRGLWAGRQVLQADMRAAHPPPKGEGGERSEPGGVCV